MRRLLIAAVLGAVVASGLAASPATADAWVDAPDVAGVGDISDLVFGGGPVWVDAATNQIRTATLSDDKTWSAPRTLAEPSGPPTLVSAERFSGGQVTATYTVGSSLYLADNGLAPQTLSTTVVAGTVSVSDFGDLFWAETVAGGQERIMYTLGGTPRQVRAPAATHYLSVTGAETGLESDQLTLGWVAGADAGSAQAWTQDQGRAAVKVSTAPARSITLSSDTAASVVAWTQVGTSGTDLFARTRSGLAKPWRAAVELSAGSPVAGASASEVSVDGPSPGYTVSWREDGPGGWAVRNATVEDDDHWAATRTLDSGTGTLDEGAYAVGAWCAPVSAGCEVRATRPGASSYSVRGTSADPDVQLTRSYVYFRSAYSDLLVWTDGPDLRAAVLDREAADDQWSWSLPFHTFSGRATARWSAEDDWSEIASYRLRASNLGPRTPRAGSYSGLKVVAAATTSTSHTFRVRDGHTRCVGLRVRDAAGNARSLALRCVTAPLDDRALRRSKGWAKVRDSGSYHHTLLRTTHRGATLSYSTGRFGAYSVVFRRSPGAGKIVVESGSWHSRVINLAGPAAQHVLVGVGGLHRAVRIRVVSSGKPVLIDGLEV